MKVSLGANRDTNLINCFKQSVSKAVVLELGTHVTSACISILSNCLVFDDKASWLFVGDRFKSDNRFYNESLATDRESPRREKESFALGHLSELELGGTGGSGGKGAGRAVGEAKPEPHHDIAVVVVVGGAV